MSEGFVKDLWVNLLPAVLAGVIGGLGAYVAVKVDIAVLMNNQEGFKEDLDVVKDVSDRMLRQESKMEFFQYQLDTMKRKASMEAKL